ncbi:MAG: Ferric transporter ATP-binding subunit [Rhodospirillales bacterium]|nr:Ferric transporter ATP-binding subunit [Rhodospirillales bacterium]
MRISRRLLLAGGAALALARPASAQEQLVAAARKEGKVTLYTSTLGAPFHVAAMKSFEQRYGITVELLDVRASELRERVRTEQTSGRFLGDVIQNGSETLLRQEQEGVLQEHGGLGGDRRFIAGLQPTDIRVPSYILGYGILINTTLIKPAEEPKSWQDLLDPRWQGKILSDDMRALGGGHTMFAVTETAFGRGFHEKLAAQHPVFSRDIGNDERRVARGEYPLRVPQLFSNFTVMKGLPVKLIIPVEGAPYVRFDLAVLKGATHPNAARLLIDHYLGDEAQLIYANAGLIPVIDAVGAKAKEDVRPMARARLMGYSKAEQQDAMLDLAKEIYR